MFLLRYLKYFVLVITINLIIGTQSENTMKNYFPLARKLIANAILKHTGKLNDGYIVADVTNYTKTLLNDLRVVMVEHGMDPLPLADERVDLIPTGHVDLTNGTLEQLSSILVYEDVFVKYTPSIKKLELTLPLGFETLVIKYHYKSKVLLVTISGEVTATITELKLNLHMGFDFTTYQLFVDKVDAKDSGKISFHFTGLSILDPFIDILINAFTTLFRSIIWSVIDLVIYDPVQTVVNDLNKLINNTLHPNATELFMY